MSSMRYLVAVVALVALVSVVTACGSSASEDASAAATIAAAQTTEAAAKATVTAAMQVIAQATAVAQALPTDATTLGVGPTAAPTPSPERARETPIPAATAPLPPMPQPQICAEESEAFWHWQAGTAGIRGFFFTTPSVGFAIGPYGLLRTDDGGGSWRAWPIDVPDLLNTVYFSSPDVGWVAGEGGTILRTTDGGLTWEPLHTGTEANLLVIKFWDNEIGWAGGSNGILLRTTDGGASWSAGAVPHMTVVDMAFVGPQEGYLVGHEGGQAIQGRVLHTTDGGATWERTGFSGSGPKSIFAAQGLPTWVGGGWVHAKLWKGVDNASGAIEPGGDGRFGQVYFSDAQHGWAIAGRMAIRTEDGGGHWQSMDVPESAYWTMLRFVSEEEAVLAATSLQVAHSSDGGRSWVMVPVRGSPTHSLEVLDMDFVDPWFGWAVVGDPSGGTDLLMTTDGGQSWGMHEVLGGNVRQVDFVDRLRGWAIGAAGLVARSDDGGHSWEMQSLPSSANMQAAYFVDRDRGWIVSTADGPGTCQEYVVSGLRNLTLFRTSSGGDEWEGPICIEAPERPSSSPFWNPVGMHFVDGETGWIVSTGGLILNTTDGGLNWQVQASEVAVGLTDVYFVDRQTGWVTGNSGVLLQTTDGGMSWKQQRLGNTALVGIRFVDKETGWVVSTRTYWTEEDDVFHTSDGGRTWNGLADAAGQVLTLDIVDEKHVWVGTTAGITAYAPVCLSPAKP